MLPFIQFPFFLLFSIFFQDFSHVHSFRGHEHKIMAVIYADGEQQLCVSADSGSGICVWKIHSPMMEEPLKKWYEQKDWRYSGIHALAYSRNGYLYTGSGDKLIKAWSLQVGICAPSIMDAAVCLFQWGIQFSQSEFLF